MPEATSARGTIAKAGENLSNLQSITKNNDNPSLIRRKKNGKYQYHDCQADEETTKNKLNDINFKHEDLD